MDLLIAFWGPLVTEGWRGGMPIVTKKYFFIRRRNEPVCLYYIKIRRKQKNTQAGQTCILK